VSKQRSGQVKSDLGRCTVREWDETEKGKFIAYVDEKNKSYDVSITLDSEQKLLDYSCDCGNEKICNHVQALLQHVTTIHLKKSQLPALKSKGLKSIVEQADPDKIKVWLWQLMSTNEEIKLLFESEFEEPTDYDPAIIKNLTLRTRKAILGKERFPANKLLARFAKALVTIQTPIVKFYLKAPFEKGHYETIKAIVEYLDELAEDMETGKLLESYIDLLLPIVEPLKQINDDELFELALGYFLANLQINKPSGVCVMNIISLLVKTVSYNRAHYLITELSMVFHKCNGHSNDFAIRSAERYKSCIVFHNLLGGFGQSLPANLVDSDTNQEIIQQLIASGNLEAASDRCWIIYNNTGPEYEKIALLQQLKSISITRGDKQEIARVLVELVPATYEYSDFVLLRDNIAPEKAARLRQLMVDIAGAELYKSPTKFRFAFQLFEAEKNYEKLLRFLHRTTSYEVIGSAFESLIKFDKHLLLQQMFRIRDEIRPDSNYDDISGEFECVDQLVNVTLNHFPEEDLRSALAAFHRNNGLYFSGNYYTAMLADAVQV
jgi:hypothetical protein